MNCLNSWSFPSVVVLCLLAGVETLAAQDWPRWRGAGFDDASVATGVFPREFGLRVAWQAEIGSGYSGISVRGDRLVTLDSKEGGDHVVALDPSTGEPCWRYRIADTFPGKDGAEDGPCGTPTLSEDSVFALGPRGHLVALDLATGKKRWATHLAVDHGGVTPHWGFTTAPLLVDDLVIVQTGGADGHGVTAFAQKTGEVRWHSGSDAVDYQSPMLIQMEGKKMALCCGAQFVTGLNPETGETVFKIPHQGAGFYGKVLHPLLVGKDKLLLKHLGGRSKLVRISSGSAGQYDFAELWSTRHISRNYNQPVLFGGHIYGHSSSFMTCTHAKTGALQWKSRPPGNGWIVLVDGHLAVLTKAGTLSVAPATPEGFRASAEIELFEHTTWTPPVFAKGRFFARDSLSRLVSVEVAEVGASSGELVASVPEFPGRLMDKLGKELAGAASGAERAKIVDEFLAVHKTSPVIEDETVAHFLFRGKAEELVLVGDLLEEGATTPMYRFPGTDLYGRSFKLAGGARVGYAFVRNHDERLTDSRNPRQTRNAFGQPLSEVVMPGRKPEPPAGEEGSHTSEAFFIATPLVKVGGLNWGGRRRVTVLLPEGYASGTRRYPVIYTNGGERAIAGTGMRAALAGQGNQPAIVVAIQNLSAYEYARSQRDHYRRMIIEEIVPRVDRVYRTVANRDGRALFGLREGAFSSLFVGLSHSDVFGFVGAQSVYLGSTKCEGELNRLLAKGETLPTIFLDWGTYDSRNPSRALDTAAFSRSFAARLRSKKCRVLGGEHNDGETLACWRERMPAMVGAFLGGG